MAKQTGRVGVVGLGLMGSAIAEVLIAKGYEVTVWNRTPAKAEPLIGAGAVGAASVLDAVKSVDALIVCVLDHAATMATIARPDVAAALRGTTLIQLTTVTSAESRELGAWAQDNGIDYLEGQILHYPADVRAGRAMIPFAGPRPVFERCATLLGSLAAEAPLLSETLGAAAVFDKALFEVEFPAYVGFLHGAAMCRSLGVPVATYTSLMARACFASGMAERAALDFGRQVAMGKYDRDVKATLETYSAAFTKTVRESEALGIETGHLAGVDALLRRACESGHARHDFSAVFELFKPGRG